MDDEIKNTKKYDLEQRTYLFAKGCKEFLKTIERSIHNIKYYKQLIRSSGSVAANFIEANEGFSRNDFSHRIKICRKEAKESVLWLKLVDVMEVKEIERNNLIQESTELTKNIWCDFGKNEKKSESLIASLY